MYIMVNNILRLAKILVTFPLKNFFIDEFKLTTSSDTNKTIKNESFFYFLKTS